MNVLTFFAGLMAVVGFIFYLMQSLGNMEKERDKEDDIELDEEGEEPKSKD